LEKNTVLIGLESWMLANRLLWVGLALAILAFTHLRFPSVTVQDDAQDFHSQGLAEVRLRHPRAADVRHRCNCVWDDREECGRSRSSSGHDACGPVHACTRGSQGSSA